MNFSASFLFFLASTTLNTVALNCIRFGVSWFVMRETGSAVAFSVIFSASSLIEVYGKPIMAPLADYFDRLKVYRICVALATACLVLLILEVVALPFSMPLFMMPLMLLSAIAALREPASAGLVPALVNPEHLVKAQSMRSSVNSIVSLAAPMLSALLLAAGGTTTALTTAGAACAIALVCTFGIRAMRRDAVTAPKSWVDYFRTWHLRTVDGVRAVAMTRSERTTAIAVALTNAGLFPFFYVVLPLWVKQGMAGNANTMAAIDVAFGSGIFVGSAILTVRMNRVLGRFHALVVGNGLLGLGLCVASVSTHLVALCACFAIGGAGFAIFNINASTLRSAATPSTFRARMAAGVAFLSSCLNPFAAQAMGFLVEHSGATSSVAVCGLLILLSTVLLLRNTDAKSLLMRSEKEIAGAYGTLYPAAFVERRPTV